jgi:predicted dehydrogenase
MTTARPPHRRAFLATTAASLAASTSALSSARASFAPNDTIGIGLIGVGGRMSAHLAELLQVGSARNVRIAAVCDVWRPARERAADRVAAKHGEAPKTFSRYADLLAAPGVDAVIIATPDFAHGTILCAALEAGKDVYIEKPMTIDLDSANRALDLARAKDLVVQAGTQRRSEGAFRAATKAVSTGALGQISRVSAGNHFNQPRWMQKADDVKPSDVDWVAFNLGREGVPFNPMLLKCWQLYKATSNGLPGLWMTHFADAVHMMTGCGYPTAASAGGGIYVWKDGREHADTFHALVEYPEDFLFDWAMSLGNTAGNHFSLHGTKGTLDVNAGTITAEAPGAKPTRFERQPSESHLENWLECLRSRAKPNADIAMGHQHVVATVMCAEALAKGRRMAYDAASRTIKPA